MSRPDFEDSVTEETEESLTEVFPDASDESDGSYDGDIFYHKQKNIYLTGNNNTIHIYM